MHHGNWGRPNISLIGHIMNRIIGNQCLDFLGSYVYLLYLTGVEVLDEIVVNGEVMVEFLLK